ncbi:hematopoietic prostaglandin D synthase-like [Asterias rubens]|uniref:hematopoietic prostaglandin D synthase-like n=1 Tax=Asterias rubens TaxID=7604 RepID=UPI0014555242|nr:hematopoietic prostaglandin D synthase-like [Asterias rubens]
MSTSYKLYYFNGKGRAESIRIMFRLAGVAFEDCRFEEAEWPAIKPSIPILQVPMLEIDGKKCGQSKAIIRYLAKKYGLFGKDDLEAFYIDTVIDTADDIVPPWDLIFFATSEEEKAKHTKNFKEVEAPLIYQRLTRLLEQDHAGDYFVGNELTAADVHFFSMVDFAEIYFPNSMAKFPKLQSLFDRVAANPKVAEWRKIRPVTSW